MTRRRATAAGALLALVLALSACSPLLPTPGESGSPMTNSLDTSAIADAITATSATIESAEVETTRDGVTTVLFVRPTISTGGLTSDELDALLRVAYAESRGAVSTIEIRTVDASDKPVDLEPAAEELGIHFLPHTNSITYSTTTLASEYGE